MVNLVLADGNAPEVMALSFANQLLCILHIAAHHHKMENKVYEVPQTIDERVAKYALASMGAEIDRLTEEQRLYRDSSLG